MPTNTAIELRFDRHLLPRTATRESIVLNAGSGETGRFLQPVYDPIERVVLYRLQPGATLAPRLLYTVEVIAPDPDVPGSFGFRAYDGALLAGAPEPVRFSFRTGNGPADTPPPAPEPDCREALDIFANAGCAAPSCHGGPEAAMGLRLDSATGLYETALDVVAHETDSGPITGEPVVFAARFGQAMPILAAGFAAESYLLYKLLINPSNYAPPCKTRYTVPLPDGQCVPPSADEITRLKDWFVLMAPMPPTGHMRRIDLERLRDFVDAGAPADGCF